MKCIECNGNMIEKDLELTTSWGKYDLILKGIKGYVCENCGEEVIDTHEALIAQNLVKAFADKSDEKPDYLNLTEVADLFRVSNQTIYNKIKSGELNAVKFGREWRFSRKNIESLLNPIQDFTIAARDAEGNSFIEDKDILNDISKDMEQDE